MVEYEVIKVVDLDRPVTGQRIIDAVKAVAGNDYHEIERIVDDSHTYLVGRASEAPDEDLIITTDRHFRITHIDPYRVYKYVAVMYKPWPGMKYAIGFGIKEVDSSMKSFRDELAEALRG